MNDISIIKVLVAAFANMIIGGLWYGPLFGKRWINLMGWNKKGFEKEKSKTNMPLLYGVQAIGSLIMAFVIANMVYITNNYLGVSGLTAGVQVGTWIWIGFIAPVSIGTVLWEGKSINLWLLNSSYYLLTVIIMSTIFSVWK